MTEAETSIEQLTDNKETTENGVIIDEILEEINKTSPPQPEQCTPPNISLNETPHIPQQMPQELPQQMPQELPQETPIDVPNQTNEIPQMEQHIEQEYQEPNIKNQIDTTTNTLGYLKDNILEELKLPSVVLLLFIILSSSKIDNLFVKTNSNFFVDSTGELTFPSIFIKAILAALIFYIFKLFV